LALCGILSYDAAGDVTFDSSTGNTYLYDAEGRICATQNLLTGQMTGYLYDGTGTRVAKGTIQNMSSCDPAVNTFQMTTAYALDLSGEQMTEQDLYADGSMQWQHTNAWAGGKLLATYDLNGLHFYFDDPLGTRRVQTDSAGRGEQTCGSLPFGNGETCTPLPTEHLFTGKERDTESGNDYFGARYYASTMGRFMSPDWAEDPSNIPYATLSDPQSLNLYSYGLNNPLKNRDSDGHSCDPDYTTTNANGDMVVHGRWPGHENRRARQSCAPFIAFFAMSGR
jgi:RHS repeat-associated protein